MIFQNTYKDLARCLHEMRHCKTGMLGQESVEEACRKQSMSIRTLRLVTADHLESSDLELCYLGYGIEHLQQRHNHLRSTASETSDT
jgi:hypothetical protein